MSGISSVDDDAFDQALRWILRLDESPADPELWRAFDAWLAQAPEPHAEALAAARAMLAALRQPAIDVADALGIDVLHPPAPAPVVLRARIATPIPAADARCRRRHLRLATAAASIVLAAVAGGWLGTGGADRLRSDAYTRVGEIRRLPLADGSVVTLNTDSAVAVRLEAGRRTARLLRGEAYFQVARDRHRPFVVASAGGSARVLGTAFDVRLDGASARVSVVHGRVSVTPPAGGAGAVLTAGQSARLDGASVQRVMLRDPFAATAWRQRRLVYYNAPLWQVARDLSRYRHGLVIVHGEAVRRMPVSGAVGVAGPDTALRTVLDALQLDAVDLPGVTIVYGAAGAAEETGTAPQR